MSPIIDKGLFRILANMAIAETLPFFRQPIHIENKFAQAFDPVTEADIRLERRLRSYLREYFPQYGIWGEEEGAENKEAAYCWVIDPIDGTRSFISGIPLWGCLVGLLHQNRAIAGMMVQPFTSELFFATEEGSFFQHKDQEIQPLRVRKTVNLAEATLFSTCPNLFDSQNNSAFCRLAQSVRLTRFGADCYAFAMLASGCIDLVVEVGLKPYDIVALIPLIEQAGGVISQWDGAPAEKGGNIIAATTPELLNAAQNLLAL